MARAASKWELTQAALGRLMARLDPDAGTAAEKYEHLRRALIKFFSWHGEVEAEACADDAIDRLARRLDEGLHIEDVPTFAYGVARMVRLERARSAAAYPVVPEEAVADLVAAQHPPTDDRLGDCLQTCLAELPAEDRTLILRYYTGMRREKIDGRALLAREMGLTANALRHRAQRVRDRLKSCARRCVETGAAARERDPGHENREVNSTKQGSRRPPGGRDAAQ
jgi:DNA-directed RNA polymerase specialized sigma24 family protein